MTVFAKAFEDYEVTQSNDFQIEVKQKRASGSNVGTKYSTAGWYLFKERIGAAEDTTINGIPINATYYNKYGELKINREVFIEMFERRFANSIKSNKTYKTDFYEIYDIYGKDIEYEKR